jgi:23S rRNA (adenine1618-N6)-methyltransferase
VKTTHVKFAGINNEIIFEGGEIKFIENIINESKLYAKNCYWFSTLVSKQSNLKKTYKLIDRTGAYFVKTISMGTGNKSSRIVAWTFQSKDAQNKWREERWQ